MSRPQTAPSIATPQPYSPSTSKPTLPNSGLEPSATRSSRAGSSARPLPDQQRFVLTDPIAFRYLEEDPTTTVLQRKQELQGYECYVVEQWATSRSHPTFTITTYTGDPSSTVLVDVLSVPTDESTWSARLRVYFKALNQYHAKRRETPLGILMVTNLSGFPSSLTVILVPDGDLRKHRNDFFVNENLKRLNCSGRVGLTLGPPSGATVAKFHQLYRTSDKNDIYQSVIELVKLCQTALLLFDKLEVDFADGLLCDITERAINDWWMDLGSRYYNVEPHDGILGPTTVAALIGLIMGARNRLHAVNAPVSKDAFDVESMKKGISAFQKQQRLPRSRRLCRRTMERLHTATKKAANSDSHWTVPKAVKNTVAELSGKGGEMVLDVVHRKDRATISEIETCDMERFVQLVGGERGKWLWYGRPLKSKSAKEAVGTTLRAGEEGKGVDGRALNFKESEHGGFTWAARKSVGDGLAALGGTHRRDDDDLAYTVEEDERSKGLLRRTTGLTKGRIKGAVGLGSHSRTISKDANLVPQSPTYLQRPSLDTPGTPLSPNISPRNSFDDSPAQRAKRPWQLQRSHTSPSSSPEGTKGVARQHMYDALLAEPMPEQAKAPGYATSYRELGSRPSKDSMRPPSYQTNDQSREASSQMAFDQKSDQEPSVRGSIDDDREVLDEADREENGEHLLRRTVSESHFFVINMQRHPAEAYPRHLSFSLAEDSVLTWSDVVDKDAESYFTEPKDQLADEEYFAREAKALRQMLNTLNASTVAFTQTQLEAIHAVFSKLDMDEGSLEKQHQEYRNQVDGLRANSETLLRAEQERLEEAGKEIETLAAKLEYEINGLKGKVEDVTAGVGDFKTSVARVEERVRELEKDEAKAEEGWGCVVC